MPGSYTDEHERRRGKPQLVTDLRNRLTGDLTEERSAAREAFRALIRGVHVIPGNARGEYRLEVETDLAPVLQTTNEEGPLAGAFGPKPVRTTVGAGTGFEPVTFRL